MPSYGRPASSLSSYGALTGKVNAASVGARAERATAVVLDRLGASPDVHVFHDVRLPGMTGQLHHVVACGDRLVVVDSKWWAPGRYWTLMGRHYRGLERIGHADLPVFDVARILLGTRFPEVRLSFLVAVTGASPHRVKVGLLRLKGAEVVPLGRLGSSLASVSKVRGRTVDPDLLALLQGGLLGGRA